MAAILLQGTNFVAGEVGLDLSATILLSAFKYTMRTH